MKTLVKLLMLLTMGALICLPGVASATVLTFDDIPNVPFTAVGAISPDINNLSTNYGGFSWTGGVQNGFWGVITNTSYAQSGYNNQLPFPSGTNVVINENGNVGSSLNFISSETPFKYNGAYFAPWCTNDYTPYYGASQLTINGYLNNILIGSQTFTLTGGPLTFVPSIITGIIDELEFEPTQGGGGYYFLMDGFNYTTVPVSSTAAPVPPTAFLLGTGLLGLVGLGWGRKKTQ
jgi:hypothetical protein